MCTHQLLELKKSAQYLRQTEGSAMLSKDKCVEKCQQYLQECHPKVWQRLLVADEAVRTKVYNLLAQYLQESAPQVSDEDNFHLLGAFGTDDSALEELIGHVVLTMGLPVLGEL
jgi:hypothetical protein